MCEVREVKPGDQFKSPGQGEGYSTMIQSLPSTSTDLWLIKFVSSRFPEGAIEYRDPNSKVFVIKGDGLSNSIKAQCSAHIWSALRGPWRMRW